MFVKESLWRHWQ